MPDTVSVHIVKSKFSQLVGRVEAGETITIVRRGKPIAKLVPIMPVRKRQFGALRGRVNLDDSFFDPLPKEELSVLSND
jgi:prevent-host-death family protein